MKQILTAVIIFIVWGAFIYFAGAFICMDLNPKNWDTGGRVIAAMGLLCGGWLLSSITIDRFY